jgi:hypothetical protein
LPYQITNVTEKVDASLFFSGILLGSNKGGDYENEVGLDEPNTQTSWVTPLRKTKNKFNKLADIRSDEYGMEIIRRKPQISNPDEDTSGDEHNWFLNQKRILGNNNYEQKNWDDSLEEIPTGINNPEAYRGFLFTPLRAMLRHGWILRAGMEQAVNLTKKIKYISSKANTTLKTWFIGEDAPLKENSDIVVNTLDRPRFLPIIKTFKHPINDALMDEILGTTATEVGGEVEYIPNTLFKFEYINEYAETERGFILSIKPKEGIFEVQLSNENII